MHLSQSDRGIRRLLSLLVPRFHSRVILEAFEGNVVNLPDGISEERYSRKLQSQLRRFGSQGDYAGGLDGLFA